MRIVHDTKKKKSKNNSRVAYYYVRRDGQSQRNGGQPEFKNPFIKIFF
jgi:hypothetical protein